jgi:hypothetical protein
MIDTLVYTFSKKFSSPKNLDRIVELYVETYNSNKTIYSTKFYTDPESYYLFEGKIDNIFTADTSNHILLDDFKLNLLPTLPNNEMIFDGDIFLEHPLSLNTEKDVVCERISILTDFPRAYSRYLTASHIYIKNGVKTVIPFFNSEQTWVPNIGMLYFNNKNTQSEYLNQYTILRNWFIENEIEEKYCLIKSHSGYYATLGQYILGLVCEHNNYTSIGFKENNSYTHLDGPIKYADNLNYHFFKNKVVKQ